MENFVIEDKNERSQRIQEDLKSSIKLKNIIRRFYRKRFLNEYIIDFRLKQFFDDWEEYRKTTPSTYSFIHFIDDEIEYNKKSINAAREKDERRRKHTCQQFDLFLNRLRNYKTKSLSLNPSEELKKITENISSNDAINVIKEPIPESPTTKQIILESILSMFYIKNYTYIISNEEYNVETRPFILDYILREFSFYKSLDNPYQNDILSFLLNIAPAQINKKHKGLSNDYHKNKHNGSLEDFKEDEINNVEKNLKSLSKLFKKMNENINSELEDIKKIKRLKEL